MKELQTRPPRQSTVIPVDYSYLHILRVAAALAVVTIHVVSKDFIVPPVTSFTWQCLNAFDVLSRWSVPAFVMISGALFLDNEKELPLKKLFFKYIPRIAVALFFWSAVYAVAYQGLYLGNGLDEIIEAFWQGHDHLWYLYMLLGLYLAVPLLRRITSSKESTRYFLVLALLSVFVFPNFMPNSRLNLFFLRVNFNMTLGYTGYFVAGYWLNRVEIKKTFRMGIYLIGLLSVIASGFVCGLVSAKTGTVYTKYYDYLSVPVMLTSVAVFVFSRYELINVPVTPLLERLSKYSFGIYLCHQIFIDALRRFLGLSTLSLNPLVSVPLITVLSFALSALTTAIIHRIPVLRRYVV